MRIDSKTILSLGLLVLLALPATGRGATTEEESPAAGLIAAGRTIPMPAGVRRRAPVTGFQRFSPPGPVRALYSQEDTLWIGTGGGLFAWGIEEDTLTAVTGPVSRRIAAIERDDGGRLWVGGDAGLSIRTESGWLHYGPRDAPLFKRVTDILRGEGRMWIASWGGGVGFVRGDSLTRFSRADSLLDDRVTCVAEETPATIWFGTASGMCRADSFSWEGFRYGSRIPIGSVEDAVFDEEGSLFIAVRRRGVAMYDLGRVTRHGRADGLPGDEIHAFSLDDRGVPWAAGKGGVSYFDGSGWVPFAVEGLSLAGLDIRAVHHDLAGRIFLGTAGGSVIVVSRGGVREIPLPDPFPASRVARIAPAKDGVWLLADGTVFRLADGQLDEIARPDPLYVPAVNDFARPAAGGLWLATRFGALHHDGRSWEVFDRRHGLPTEHLTAVAAGAPGELWFGTFDSGVLRLGRAGWTHFTEQSGLPGESIADIAVDADGTVWAGMADGRLARLAGERWETVDLGGDLPHASSTADTLERIDPALRLIGGTAMPGTGKACRFGAGVSGRLLAVSGAIWRLGPDGARRILPLPDERIKPTALTETAAGEIWLATDGDGLWILADGRWRHVGAADGVVDDRLLSVAGDAWGTVWIGTANGGIVRFRPPTRDGSAEGRK